MNNNIYERLIEHFARGRRYGMRQICWHKHGDCDLFFHCLRDTIACQLGAQASKCSMTGQRSLRVILADIIKANVVEGARRLS